MLTELHGKAGCLCQPAREGTLRCPLIVRSTSEDVITSHLIQAFRILNPRWYLPDLLNASLGAERFHRQVYRRLKIDPWVNQPRYPRELLPWDEGSTQVDCVITWENAPTTVFIEAKFGSELTQKTAGDDGSNGFPSDQLIRNARVGLLQSGWFTSERLFGVPPRDFVLILLSPSKKHQLVQQYRNPDRLREAIPHSDRLPRLPRMPFIGELVYGDIIHILHKQKRCFSRPERVLIDTLTDYLQLKKATVPYR